MGSPVIGRRERRLGEAREKAREEVRADMGQVLAARERELRGCLADKELLASRNRQAASLLDDRCQALHHAEVYRPPHKNL